MPIQFFGLRFGLIANCLRLLFQFVGFRISLRFDRVPLILERFRLRITRLARSPVYAVGGSASALSWTIPVVGHARRIGCRLVSCCTCLLLRSVASRNHRG